jgi:hypothetical protein
MPSDPTNHARAAAEIEWLHKILLHSTEHKQLEALQAAIDAATAEVVKDRDFYKNACIKQNAEICQILGKALGWPMFADDQTNFPGATEADGVFVGEHVAETLAAEAASKLAATAEKDAEIHEVIKFGVWLLFSEDQ